MVSNTPLVSSGALAQAPRSAEKQGARDRVTGARLRHLIVGAALALVTLAAQSDPVVAVLAPQIEAPQVGARLHLEGRIEPVRQATVAAQGAGSVLEMAVKAGDQVRAGQSLARLDARDAQAGLERSSAAVSQVRAEAQLARTHLDRTRELRKQGFVSAAALDMAQTQAQAALATLEQAQAAQAQAQLAREHAVIAAPFDGVVLATHLDAGDLAAPGRAIVTIYAPGALRAVVQVPTSRAPQARSAARIEVQLADGRWVTPARREELATADPVSQTIEWRLHLPAQAHEGMRPGQAVRVRFFTAQPADLTPRVRLPQAAVLRRGELTAVYLAQGETFVLRAIRLGQDHGAEGVDVLAGLRPGDRVAAHALQAGLAGARPAR